MVRFGRFALWAVFVSIVFAQPVLHYQGKLVGLDDVAVNDTVSMTFKLYDCASGGSAIWGETHSDVVVTKGLFSVVLGEISPLDLPFDTQYWLEISVNGAVMVPRVKLAASPYAFRAVVADSLTGGVPDESPENELITSVVWEPDSLSHHTLRIVEHSVQWDVVIPVDEDDLSDNVLGDLSDVDVSGVVSGQVLKWDGSAWRPADDANIRWDTLGAYVDTTMGISSLSDVNTAGVSDGQVLAWVEAAGEWRPTDLGSGAGDNWGTQVVVSDSSLLGDGTPTDTLRVNWDTLGAYYDTLSLATAGAARVHWENIINVPESILVDGSRENELITDFLWFYDTLGGRIRVAEGGSVHEVFVPTHEDHLADNSIGDLGDVSVAGVVDGQVLKWFASAGEWRPANDIGGGVGDNWGTQVVVSDSSLLGDGTASEPLRIAFENLDFVSSLVWEPEDSLENTLRLTGPSDTLEVVIPADEDDLSDNVLTDLGDVDTAGLEPGVIMVRDSTGKWVFRSIVGFYDDKNWHDATDYIYTSAESCVDVRIYDLGDTASMSIVQSDSTTTGEWYGLLVSRQSHANANGKAIYAYAGALAGVGTTNEFYGVYGKAGYGARNYGVYGDAEDVGTGEGYGVYGRGRTVGVYGRSGNYGVYGDAEYAGTGEGYGVYGKGRTAGVYGESDNYGVYGISDSCAIYGYSETGFGCYFDAPKNYFSGNVGIGPGADDPDYALVVISDSCAVYGYSETGFGCYFDAPKNYFSGNVGIGPGADDPDYALVVKGRLNPMYRNYTEPSICIGKHACDSLLSSGRENIAIGRFALRTNEVGSGNIAIGYKALADYDCWYFLSTYTYNIAIGSSALTHLRGEGGLCLYNVKNTAVGYGALENLKGTYYGAYCNTAFGAGALKDLWDGEKNTACGGYAGPTSADSFVCNTTALGFGAKVTADNQVRIGNTSVTSIGGYANWTNLSDGRFKKDVREDVPGLVFIRKLRPVTYHLDVRKLNRFLGVPDSMYEDTIWARAVAQKEAIVQSGFIAQEVEEAARSVGYDFSGVDAPQDEHDLYGLRYAEFVVPLVKAVQELDEENKKLREELARQKEEFAKQKEELARQKRALEVLEAKIEELEARCNVQR